VILCDSYELDEPLPYNIQYIATQRPNYALSAFDPSLVEKLHIQRLLNHTNGNRAKAAGLLNIGIAILLSR
jgi:transcriptional regulator with PAS, ATPase and Fis domain